MYLWGFQGATVLIRWLDWSRKKVIGRVGHAPSRIVVRSALRAPVLSAFRQKIFIREYNDFVSLARSEELQGKYSIEISNRYTILIYIKQRVKKQKQIYMYRNRSLKLSLVNVINRLMWSKVKIQIHFDLFVCCYAKLIVITPPVNRIKYCSACNQLQ